MAAFPLVSTMPASWHRSQSTKPNFAPKGSGRARRKGKKWGLLKKGWRWKVIDDQLAAIHEMRAGGKKTSRISMIVGLSRPTIYRVLASSTVTGTADDIDKLTGK